METDERFESGRKVAKLLLASAIDGEEHRITAVGEDLDMAYFIERATCEDRRVGLKRRRRVCERLSVCEKRLAVGDRRRT